MKTESYVEIPCIDIKSDLDAKLYKYRADVLNFCQNHDFLYLYGCGYFANRVFNFLKIERIKIKGVIVTQGQKKTKDFNGLPVYEMNRNFIDKNAGIIIAVAQYEDIDIWLNECGIPCECVFHWKCYEKVLKEPEHGYQNTNMKPNGEFFLQYKELDDLGEQCGTDKGSTFHNYLSKYEFFLTKFKNCEFKLCELGVYHGASIEMWSRYFPKAEIIGVDIDRECMAFNRDRKRIHIFDLSKEENLKKLGEMIGNPKIIIDDASHRYSHQIKALITLFPYLKSGGIYIMEDLGTSFGKNRKTIYNDALISGYEFCRLIAETVVGSMLNELEENLNWKKEVYSIASQLDMITFIQGACIMVKG